MHSSEKTYHCKECNQTYKGPTYYKHLKSKKHKRNVAKFNSPLTDSTASRYFSYSNSSLTPFPNDTGKTDVNRHATNFMSSLHKLVDMYYSEYTIDATTTGTDVGVSISLSKMDAK